MKDFNELLETTKERNPYWSSYVIFFMSFCDKKESKNIEKMFKKFVEKDDYGKNDENDITTFIKVQKWGDF